MFKTLYINPLYFFPLYGKLCLSLTIPPLFKWFLRLFTIVFLLFSPFYLFSQDEESISGCDDETEVYEVDLSDDPNAVWELEESITFGGHCCPESDYDLRSNDGCVEFIVTLHEDAKVLDIFATQPMGDVIYFHDCGQAVGDLDNLTTFCFDDPGPRSIVFCRPGTPSYDFTFESFSELKFEVTLDPFDPVCETDDEFELTGGSPDDEFGVYYIDGEEAENAMFDPAYYGPGDYEIVYEYYDENTGCYGSATQELIVMPIPEVEWDGQEICDYGGLVPLEGGSPEGGEYYAVEEEHEDYIVDNNFDTDEAEPGTYEVVYYYEDEYGACSAETIADVVVYEVPTVDAGEDQTIAENTSAELEAEATGGSGDYYYEWEPADLVVDQNSQDTETEVLDESTVFTVTVIDNGTGCIATDQVEVIVTGDALKIIDITATPETICFGETSQLWVQPSGGSGTYFYEWSADPAGANFDPDNEVRMPVVDPGETTEFTVIVTDDEDREADSTVVVTVLELPDVSLDLEVDSVCANTPNFALTGGEPEGGSYYLHDENDNPLYYPDIDFSNFFPHDIGEGNYLVYYEYTDEAGCYDIAGPVDFVILPYVEADFHTHVEDICQSNVITINNFSVGEDLDYDWLFGDDGDGEVIDGNTDEDQFTYEYEHHEGYFDEDYTITLTVSNEEGCTHTYQREVTVNPKVIVDFEIDPPVSEDCSPLLIEEFINLSYGAIYYYYWDFGDGTSSMDINPENKIYNNYGDSDTTYTVELEAVSYNFLCSYTYSEDITVYPEVQAGFAVDSVEACAPHEFKIMNNAVNAEVYEWEFDGDGEVVDGELDGDSFIYKYENPGPEIDTFTVTQTVWIERDGSEVCHDIYEKDIVVFPEVVIDEIVVDNDDLDGCAPHTVQFGVGQDPENATEFLWDFDDGGTSSLEAPEHTFENTTDDDITYEVMLVAWSENSCYDTSYVDITVHPQVTAGFDFSPANICQYQEVEFTNTSDSGSDMVYDWYFEDEDGEELVVGDPDTEDAGLVLTEGDPDDIDPFSYRFFHNADTPQKYYIDLTTTTDECEDIAIDSITVYPKVVAAFNPVPDEGCSPLEVYFENESTGAGNYQWHFGDGDASSTQDEPTHIFENPEYDDIATFDVELIAESEYLCSDTIYNQIEVDPTPKASFTVDTAGGCSPFELNVTNNSEGAQNYSWILNNEDVSTNENPVFDDLINTSAEPDTIMLYLEVVNDPWGCTDADSTEIIVYPEIVAGFEEVEDGCHPHYVKFVNQTINETEDQAGDEIDYHIDYEWEFGDGTTSIQEDPEHTYLNFSHTNEVDYVTQLYAESEYGCQDNFEQHDITVFSKPLASFWVEDPQGCSPHEVIIHDASEGGSEFTLDMGDGTVYDEEDFDFGFSETHEYYIDPGDGTQVYDIVLEVENDEGCNDIYTQKVTIYPDIIAEFSVGDDEDEDYIGCHPFTVDFINESQGASAYIEYEWDFGDGNSSTEIDPRHVFNNYSNTGDTTYTVTLTAYYEGACYDIFEKEITVQASPLADFSVPNSPGCAPHDIVIENESVGATSFQWDFGDESPADESENPDPHEYIQPAGEGEGIFTITLDVWHENGCHDQYQQDVTIYPVIEAGFDMNEEGCHPLEVYFENETEGGDIYNWDFGEGNQSQEDDPTHLFYNYSNNEVVTRTVTLYAESNYGCQSEYSDTVTINPQPKADFTLSETSGCSPFTPEVINKSEGEDLDYHWDFTNDTSEQGESSFTHTWTNKTDSPVDFDIILTTTNEYGCIDTVSEKISVYPEVTADFTTSDEEFAGCSPFAVDFVNESHLGKTYKWDFGDGSTSTSANPMNVFVNENIQIEVVDVGLIATSDYGCKDTVERELEIYPSPEADFTALPKEQPYPESTVTLENLTSPGEWIFEWDFGDGSDIYETDDFDPFEYTYEWDDDDMTTKTYIITLTAFNELCYDVMEREVTITSPVPEADFEPSTQGCEPFEVQFQNNSLYSNNYRWYFGDESISVEENPSHVFVDPGEYDVMLVAIGDGGRDTSYREVTVFENPAADFELVSNYLEIPHDPLEVINKSKLAEYYYWEFGDGSSSTEFEPVYYYETPDVYDITLTVYTDTNPQCSDTKILESALRVDESCQVLLPNAFKPSDSGPSDGVCDPNNPTNEVFCPLHEGVEEYTLEIFNKWGELIFRSTDPDIGWDGYYRGRLAKTDVYVWKVTGRCTNGQTINKSGDVTLIR